jgi:hypothetical protein
MPNTTVRAAAEGMPTVNRRAAMVGAGATMAALAASTRLAPAAASPLLDLIESHKRAHAAYILSLDTQEEVEFAYRDAFPAKELLVPLSIGGGVSLHLGSERHVDDCRAAIARAYKAKEASLPSVVGSLGIASADEVTRRLRKAQGADLRTMRRMVAEDMAQREAFGLLSADRAVKAASEAEDDAEAALLAYPCLTREEIRMRAGYVTSPGSGSLIYDGLTSGTDFLVSALLFASMEEGGVA